MADQIRATPQNPTLGAIAAALRRAQQFTGQYQVDPRIPLLGGTGVDELLSLPGAASLMEDVSYNGPRALIRGGNVATGGIGTFRLDPRVADVADVALNVSPLAAVAGKAATRGATAVGRAGERMAERVVPSIMERGGVGAQALQALGSGTTSNVIKPKGGNWLQGSIERAVERMRTVDPAMMDVLRNADPRLVDQTALNRVNAEALALDKWLDKKLRNYIRNEMGTPEDPVRALAERGVLHYEMPGLNTYNLNALERARQAAGFPVEGMATTRLGREWEAAADRALYPSKAGYLVRTKEVDTNPFLLKVPPETMVHEIGPRSREFQSLGFGHLVDELRNAVNPESGLPRELLWKYSDLDKVTVPQAVERVAKINEWRAAQKAEADLARAMNPATQVFKEYPEQGFRWVELKAPEELSGGVTLEPKAGGFDLVGPNGEDLGWAKTKKDAIRVAGQHKALEDALKYEGEVMGHCVGGYCPDVLEGRSRIFSLRDKKGQPHVTVEVAPDRLTNVSTLDKYVGKDRAIQIYDEYNAAKRQGKAQSFEDYALSQPDVSQAYKEIGPTESIVQIKGKANKAPKEEYLPFVQDFVRSQQWGRVGDLQNTGLVSLERPYTVRIPAGNELRELNVPPGYYTPAELEQRLIEQGASPEMARVFAESQGGARGFSAGGLVKGAVKSLGDLLDKYVAKGAPLVRKYGRDEAVAALEESQKANLQHQPLLESLHRYHADENPRIADIIEGMYDDLERGVDTGAAARAYDEGYRLPGARLSFGKDIAVRSPRAWTPGLHFAAPGNEAQLAPLIERYFSEFGPRSRSLSPVARPVLARADRPIQLPDLAFEDPALLASKLGLSAEFRAALRNKPDATTAEKSQVITQLLARRGVDLGAYTNVVEGQLGAGNTSYVSFGKNKIRGFAAGGAVRAAPQSAAVPYDEAKIDALASALTA